MAAVLAVIGQVRAVREFRRRADATSGDGKAGDVLGRNVSVLTELSGELGETLTVTIWDRDRAVKAEVGEWVEWVVDVSTGQYGLQANFVRILAQSSPDKPATAAA